MVSGDDLFELASITVGELRSAGMRVATAESCTGGWISKAITDVAGSSAVFAYGIVSYSNDAKESLLGVNAITLEANGAVSAAVVEEMASGALRLSGADVAVAVSGVAGPDGGSDEKPVGTVWFAWSHNDARGVATDSEQHLFSGDRRAIRESTVACALQGVRERIV